ncbi:MAG: hypothetical protein ABIP75_13670 [Pyrinomonadaceae bacterium]
MSITRIEGVVENGQIRIVGNVQLPEHARVYVILPGDGSGTEGPKFDLAELVSRMPQDYQVIEEDFGEPVGKEEW